MRDDRDLRERFARQRAEEAPRTPDFARTWAGAQELGRRPRRRRRRLALVGAAAIVAIVLLLAHPSSPPMPSPPDTTPSLADWRAPTDFLLQTPGRELLTTLPRLGREVPPTRLSPLPERSTSP